MDFTLERMEPFALVRAFATTLLLMFSASPILNAQDAQPVDYDQPFRVASRTDADPNLYAMSALNAVYEAWPSLDGKPEVLGSWFTAERQYLTSMSGIIRARNLDPQIAARYQDTLDMVSTTMTYLSNLDLIRKRNEDQAPFDLLSSIFSGYQTSTSVQGTAEKYTSKDTASNIATMAGLASAYSNYQQKANNRSANEIVAVQAETRKLQDGWAVTQAALQTTASSLTTKYGWAQGEAGFDTFHSPSLSDMIARAPRNPFIRASYASTLSKQAKTGNDEVPAINAFMEAASMVPDDGAFSSTRGEFIAQGVLAAIRGANLDSGNTFARAVPSAGNAVKMARTYLSFVGQDQGGTGHYYLSLALSYAGRFPEAIRAAQDAYDLSAQAWKNSSSFCLTYASLMSLTGNEQEAANWIVNAYRDGYRDIGTIKTNADFAPLRQKLPERFHEITSSRVEFHLRFDTHPASVVIQNNSDFDLVKPVLALRIRKGQQIISAQASCNYIQAGHSCQVDNVVSIPGDSDDGEDASIAYANQ